MPRHVINLAPEEYQFNDQPLLHEGIWKAASTIAQAPLQMAQMRMQMQQADLARQEHMLRMQEHEHNMKYHDAIIGERNRHNQAMEKQKAADSAHKATIAKKTPRELALESAEKSAHVVPDDTATSEDRSAAVHNAQEISKQKLGQHTLTRNEALVSASKPDESGSAIPYAERNKRAEKLYSSSYNPTLGEDLSGPANAPNDLGSPPSLKMAMTPEAPDYGAQPGAAPQPAADTNQPSGSPAHTLHARLKTLAPEVQTNVINNMKTTNPALLEQILRLHAAERGISAPGMPAAEAPPTNAMPAMRMAEPY